MRQTIRKAKHAAWVEFSKYIRTKNASHNGFVRCVTCDTAYHWKQMQAGHFTDGRHNNTLFDERNVHSQCKKCNLALKGNKLKYYKYMLEKYGQGVIDELEILDDIPRKFTLEELKEMRKKFKSMVRNV